LLPCSQLLSPLDMRGEPPCGAVRKKLAPGWRCYGIRCPLVLLWMMLPD
jgi:hypothetical protein